MSQLHMLVRVERELSLRAAYGHPPLPRRRRPRLRRLRVGTPWRRPEPQLAPHQYLELEFIVDERR